MMSIVLYAVVSPSYIIGWKEAERDILQKMSISNNSNITNIENFLENCLMSFAVPSSPFSSHISNHIAACAVHIVFAIAGTIVNSFVLFIFWKSQKLRSKLSYFSIMLLSSIDLGVVTVVDPLFVLKSITTMLDSVMIAYIAML